MNRLSLLLVLLLPVCGARAARAQSSDIPSDGLQLWLKADGPMKVSNGQVSEWTDTSGKGNNALHDGFGANDPSVATANGRPTLTFSGAFTGFHFTQIATIRTVFAVLSKAPASCLPTLPNYGTPAKFWIGGSESQTYFHPEHGCSIWNSNLSEVSPNLVNGKTYLNGKLVDGRKTYFPFELGLISAVSTGNVTADTVARDRTFQDRSWQGNISELLIYSRPLDDATRVSIENALIDKYAIGIVGGSGGQGAGVAGSTAIGGGGATAGAENAAGGLGNASENGGGPGTSGSAGQSTQGGALPTTASGGSGASGALTNAGGGNEQSGASNEHGSAADTNSGCSCGTAPGKHTTDGIALALLACALCLLKRNGAR